MIRALQEEGHELQIFMRPPAADMAREIFPQARIEVIRNDPYQAATKARRNPFRAEHRAIRRFCPDLYVAALFHLNFFDQVWLERGRHEERIAGFSCEEEFWPAETTEDPRTVSRKFDTAVTVPGDLPEIEKNRRLAETILSKPLREIAPRLDAGAEALTRARVLLARHQLEEDRYFVACLGFRRGLQMKDWGEENWIAFFRETADDRPLVFLGNPAESASIERIREKLGPRHLNLAASPPDIAVSLGLVSLSAGYIGRDSGVMHMAAAAGRPVLAIFGGGHWGRFLPSAGVVVAQDWPCRGSNFACAHDEPYCIRDVPLDAMLAGWKIFQILPPGELKIVEEPLDQGRLEGIAREASRKYARLLHENRRLQQQAMRPVNALDALGLKIRTLARILKP